MAQYVQEQLKTFIDNDIGWMKWNIEDEIDGDETAWEHGDLSPPWHCKRSGDPREATTPDLKSLMESLPDARDVVNGMSGAQFVPLSCEGYEYREYRCDIPGSEFVADGSKAVVVLICHEERYVGSEEKEWIKEWREWLEWLKYEDPDLINSIREHLDVHCWLSWKKEGVA